MTNEPLVSRNVSMRQREQDKQKTQQHYEINVRRVNRETNAYNQSVAATTDTHMVSALEKVREQNHITHSPILTKLNGTYFHNQSRIKE